MILMFSFMETIAIWMRNSMIQDLFFAYIFYEKTDSGRHGGKIYGKI